MKLIIIASSENVFVFNYFSGIFTDIEMTHEEDTYPQVLDIYASAKEIRMNANERAPMVNFLRNLLTQIRA